VNCNFNRASTSISRHKQIIDSVIVRILLSRWLKSSLVIISVRTTSSDLKMTTSDPSDYRSSTLPMTFEPLFVYPIRRRGYSGYCRLTE
jgi:hypothetical protein